jgi:hypothetical protein
MGLTNTVNLTHDLFIFRKKRNVMSGMKCAKGFRHVRAENKSTIFCLARDFQELITPCVPQLLTLGQSK